MDIKKGKNINDLNYDTLPQSEHLRRVSKPRNARNKKVSQSSTPICAT